MISLFRSWGNSIKLLWPSRLKEWGLLTLKGSIGTYKLLFRYFWWLILGFFATYYFELYFDLHPEVRREFGILGLPGLALLATRLILGLLWCISCLLATRPSVKNKSIGYFVEYWRHALVAGCLIVGMYVLTILLYIFTWEYASYIPVHVLNFFNTRLGKLLFIDLFFLKPVLYTLFFLFDTQLTLLRIIKSIWHGYKFIVYLLPILLLMSIILYGFLELILLLTHNVWAYVIWSWIVLLFLPIYMNVFIYLYLKERYEHSERYQ